jgi:hypothetical protein
MATTAWYLHTLFMIANQNRAGARRRPQVNCELPHQETASRSEIAYRIGGLRNVPTWTFAPVSA